MLRRLRKLGLIEWGSDGYAMVLRPLPQPRSDKALRGLPLAGLVGADGTVAKMKVWDRLMGGDAEQHA